MDDGYLSDMSKYYWPGLIKVRALDFISSSKSFWTCGLIWHKINLMTVEHLITQVWHSNFEDLANLKTLEVGDGTRINSKQAFRNFHKLEKVAISEIYDYIEQLMISNSKLVCLHTSASEKVLLNSLVPNGIKLQELRIKFDDSMDLKQRKIWLSLGQLINLHSLTIICTRSNNEAISDFDEEGMLSMLRTLT